MVAAGVDGTGDQVPLDAASAGVTPAEADLLGFGVARTGPLDDATFQALFGDGGMLAVGTKGVFHPQAFTLDPESFRTGLQIAWLRAAGPPPASFAGNDSYVVAAEYLDPAFPVPPSGTFAGINKVHRFEMNAAGADIALRQFDGRMFGVFRTDTVLATTCTGAATGPCDWFFFSALDNPEIVGHLSAAQQAEGITEGNGEVFRHEGDASVFDRLADPVDITTLESGELGTTAVRGAHRVAVPIERGGDPERSGERPERLVRQFVDDRQDRRRHRGGGRHRCHRGGREPRAPQEAASCQGREEDGSLGDGRDRTTGLRSAAVARGDRAAAVRARLG